MIDGFAVDEVYLRAAAGGDCHAQAGLAGFMLKAAQGLAEVDHAGMNELLVVSETFARLAAARGSPSGAATLGMVWFVRSLILAESDPPRSLSFRQDADGIFDSLAANGDSDALLIAAYTLTMFAELAEDEAAAERLNSIVALLPPESAVLLREWTRRETRPEPAAVVKETR